MGGFLSDIGTNLKLEHWVSTSVMKHTHVHPQYELYFCSDDISQTSVINGVRYEYHYPCAILSTPFTVHSMSSTDPAAVRFERYVFYFDEKLLASFDKRLVPQRMLGKNTGLLFPLSVDQASYLKQLLDLCYGEDNAERELSFMLFLNKLVKFCPEDRVIQVGTTSFYIQDVLQYISENFSDEFFDVDKVARRFAVSRSKLDRDFKRFTGVTVHGFVEICRLNQAKYLLEFRREMSVGEISQRCGFENETHFYPFFKKHTGLTPLEYRREAK